jgi:regulator of replication initiation timing
MTKIKDERNYTAGDIVIREPVGIEAFRITSPQQEEVPDFKDYAVRRNLLRGLEESARNLCYVVNLALIPRDLEGQMPMPHPDMSEIQKTAHRLFFQKAALIQTNIVRIFFNEDKTAFIDWARSLGYISGACDIGILPSRDIENSLVNDVMANRAIHWAAFYYPKFFCENSEDKTTREESSVLFAFALYSALYPDYASRLRDLGEPNPGSRITKFMRFFSAASQSSLSFDQFAERLVESVGPEANGWLARTENARKVEHLRGVLGQSELTGRFSLRWLLGRDESPIPITEAEGAFLKTSVRLPVFLLRTFTEGACQDTFSSLIDLDEVVLNNDSENAFVEWASGQIDRYVKQTVREREKLKAKLERVSEENARLDRANEIAQEQAGIRADQEKQEKLIKFHSEFQEVPRALDSKDFLEKLTKVGLTQEFSRKREALESLFGVVSLLDYRGDVPAELGDPKVKKLVDAVLSVENLTRLIRCYGFPEAKYLNEYRQPTDEALDRIATGVSEVYNESDYIKTQIETVFLEDPDTRVLVATLLLSSGEVETYLTRRQSSILTKNRDDKYEDKFKSRILSRLGDLNIKRRVKALLIEVNADQPTASKIQIKPAYFPQLEVNHPGLILDWDSRRGECLVILRNDERVNFSVKAKKFTSLEDDARIIDQQIEKKRQEILLDDNSKALESLVEGIVIRESGGSVIQVKFEPGQINEVLNPDKRESYKLERALYALESYLHKVSELKNLAARVGMVYVANDAGWRFTREGKDLVSGNSGYIPSSKFNEISRILGEQEQERIREGELQKTIQLVQERREAKRAASALSVIPSENSSVLIVDSSVLIVLLAPIDATQPDVTYLGVLKAFAQRANKRVYIPASVLFEVSGSAWWLDDSGAVKTADIKTYNYSSKLNIQKFVDEVAHVRLSNDPSGTPITDGSASQIAIVYRPEDKVLFEEAEVHLNNSWKKGVDHVASFASRYFNAQLGDTAITHLCRHLPGGCPVVVATGDRRFAQYHMYQRGPDGAPIMAVGMQTLLEFVLGSQYFNLKAASLGSAPNAREAIGSIIEWLGAQQKGPGSSMIPDGARIRGVDSLKDYF